MYRKIVTEFWTDSTVEELSSDAKLVLLYMLTAPMGTIQGCYEVTTRRISKDTDLSNDAVASALSEICDTNIAEYSHETNEVLLKNWPRYNWTKSKSLVKPICEGVEAVKEPGFKAQLMKAFEDWFEVPYEYGIDTVSTQCRDHPDTHSVSVSVTDTVTDKGVGVQGKGGAKPSKHRHGEFDNVLLTDDELSKLKDKFPSDWQSRIDDLSYYIGSKGDKYKSHYRTILSWNRKNEPRKGAVGDGRYAKYD